jgi:hypothetical protein
VEALSVEGLRCYFRGETFSLRLSGRQYLSVEIHGGRVKADLFERAFGLKLLLKTEG